jgi:asparagine synthase (glutamine-hydrolysing)
VNSSSQPTKTSGGAIYGWASFSDAIFPNDVLDRQTKSDKCLTSNPRKTVGFSSIACVGGHALGTPPSVYQSENLLVILEGSPNWLEPDLAKIAKTQSPAHALAEAFSRQGLACLEKIRGAFSFCIIEPKKQYALLAVDRIGTRPLAFYFQNELLVFGSQLDQILAHPGVETKIDPQAIYNYLYFHMIPSPGTIYSHISKLQPAEYIEIHKGHIKREFYWQVPYAQTNLSKNELLAKALDQLEQSTLDCEPDNNTGTFLSGGLDSSTVTGMLQKISNHPIDAFTMGFEAEGYDEMEYARAAAKHFKVNLHEYYVTPADVLKAIPLIASTYDEPFGNASAIPAYYCAKLAREKGMTRLLAGDGGDEIFAGNSRYAKQKIFDLYRHIPGAFKSMLEPIASGLPPLRKVKSYIEQAKIPMPDRMETYNFLHRSPLAEIFQEDFLRKITPAQPAENLNNTYNRSNTDDLVKKMLFLDAKFTLADNDLRKVNRMCDLAGIQVQYPMLNENLVEFAASIPSEWLMQGFELRSFYRKALKEFLPKETLSKSKQGFGLPFGVWMSTDKNLKTFAEESLQGIKSRDILNPVYIDNLIKLHQEGNSSYYGVMIWILMMLDQWLNTHKH